jgi:hypothetical protein
VAFAICFCVHQTGHSVTASPCSVAVPRCAVQAVQTSLALTPDGTQVVTADEQCARVWDLHSGSVVTTLDAAQQRYQGKKLKVTGNLHYITLPTPPPHMHIHTARQCRANQVVRP